MLHIVEPDQNGPGGDLPVVLWSAARGTVEVICGQGVAPAAADVDALLGLGLDVMPGTGHLPAVVPGSFDAWMLLLRDHGTMTPRQVLEPAIHIARDGFVLKPAVARLIAGLEAVLRRALAVVRGGLPAGRPGAGGRRAYALPAQGDTYERILREAESAGARPGGADRGGTACVVPGLRGRGDRPRSSASRSWTPPARRTRAC